MRRSFSNELGRNGPGRLPPIPASPYATDASVHSSSQQSLHSKSPRPKTPTTPVAASPQTGSHKPDSPGRARSKSSSYVSRRPAQPQSLSAAIELLAASQSEGSHVDRLPNDSQPNSPKSGESSSPSPSTRRHAPTPPSPHRTRIPSLPNTNGHHIGRNASGITIAGKEIGLPILNHGLLLLLFGNVSALLTRRST